MITRPHFCPFIRTKNFKMPFKPRPSSLPLKIIMSGAGGRASAKNVAYNKPQEPSFLKAFKAKVGYKEPATLDAKREGIKPPCTDGDEVEDRDDELPTVVVLRPGDVGQEEFLDYKQRVKDQAKEEKKSTNDRSDITDTDGGRIMFKKPTKRKSSESTLDASSSKKAKSSSHSQSSKSSQNKSKTKKIKNKSLLSFGDEDDLP